MRIGVPDIASGVCNVVSGDDDDPRTLDAGILIVQVVSICHRARDKVDSRLSNDIWPASSPEYRDISAKS